MKTPLYEAHRARGARMAPFAGWDMPIQYDGILAEHRAVRTDCGVFDTCHMGEFELTGPAAAADLDRLLTCPVATLDIGQCRYGYLLNDAGGVLDDLTCYRLGPERFWLVVNAGARAGDADWVRAHCSAGTFFADRSDATGKLDVQGPAARARLESAFGITLPELRYFHAAEIRMADAPVLLSRTGYTGEWGYELYFPAVRAVEYWERLTSPGGAVPAGLGARDTLRLEMGYPLYGHELTADRTPAGAMRASFADFRKPFVGAVPLRRAWESGAADRLVGLRLDGRRAARADDTVWSADKMIGRVTSGAFAPSLGVAAALAYVRPECAAPGTTLEIAARGERLSAHVEELPLYRKGTARKKM